MKPLRSIKYHDRTGLIPATQLSLFSVKVRKQEKKIYQVFLINPDRQFSARTLKKYLKQTGVKILLSSVRRSCTHLKQAGWIRSVRFTKGAMGKPVYWYKLNKRK